MTTLGYDKVRRVIVNRTKNRSDRTLKLNGHIIKNGDDENFKLKAQPGIRLDYFCGNFHVTGSSISAHVSRFLTVADFILFFWCANSGKFEPSPGKARRRSIPSGNMKKSNLKIEYLFCQVSCLAFCCSRIKEEK